VIQVLAIIGGRATPGPDFDISRGVVSLARGNEALGTVQVVRQPAALE
jgi:hypothetical protein